MCLSKAVVQLKNEKLIFGYINKKKILAFNIKKVNYYFELKNSVKVFKMQKEKLLLKTLKEELPFTTMLASFNILKKKILILKGLGLKAFLFPESSFLLLKLGFSHSCNIYFDSEISIKLFKKNFIQVKSFNTEKLGSFAFRIKCLRKPDSFQGKGVYYKTEKVKLKPVKKK